MINLYQGEPRIFLDENGAELKFIGGQPVMDGGFENAVLISLFTRPGWFANTFFPAASQQIGSDYEEISMRAITVQNLNDRRQAAEAALNWMISTGVASEITVDVRNNSGFRVDTTITIRPPGSDIVTILLSRNGNNWVFQTLTPANLRG